MAETAKRMPLAAARLIAEAVRAELAPRCQRIEIAGSIRREKPDIGDVEIVAIPLPKIDLFGTPVGGETLLDPLLDRLCGDGRLAKIKRGEKYAQFRIVKAGINLDLFLASPATWACIFVIRTGSAQFTHRLVTQKSKGGLCPDDCRFSEGRLWRGGKPVELAEEVDLFRELGLAWIEPRER